ncbi:hypothetical protein GE061_010882 [Apolygus lucorum]|uniref:Sodium/potassium-transporting ATPase subunit beta-1-interacting protein n=1 Tax=Apolygus lucorum TaxID=248454 RepID=A0A8S9XW76_APOLU|nr:hypothetical protein GE061_010882 [Apolygus lucorum]
MGCNKRLFLLTVCICQVVTTVWRQVFDFLGYMWGPIIINFFQIIFSIFGIFGAWQLKSNYIISYCLWTLVWCAWNSFVFCYYENVGILDRNADILSLGTGSDSWWHYNGPGCNALFLPNETGESLPWAPLKPNLVTGCLLPYQHVEATQAVIHIILAVFGFFVGITLNHRIRNGKQAKNYDVVAAPLTLKKSGAPMYPVDLMPRRITDNTTESSEEPDLRQKPMTPRRVKRRSISRGTLPPYSGPSLGPQQSGPPVPQPRDLGSFPRRHNHHRSSTRSSSRSRSTRPNPVTRLMDHQESSRGHTNHMFQHSPENSLVYEPERPPSARSSYSNYHGTRPHSYRHSHNFLVQGPPGYSSQSETAI